MLSKMVAALGLSTSLIVAQDNPPKSDPAKPAISPTIQNKNKKNNRKGNPAATAPTSGNRYFLEPIRQLRGEMEELKGAYNLQIRKMMSLGEEVKNLRVANENLKRENALRFASNKDIDELADKLKELDKNRRNDLDLTNKQIDEILKIVKKLANTPAPTPPPTRNTAPPATFKAREHIVQTGEFLSTILSAYNAAFKTEGLKGRVSQSQVLKANPGMKPDRLLVGQKLLIPLPGEIK